MAAMATATTGAHSDEMLTQYLREIGRYPLLTAAEEHALGTRAQAGDASARERLVACNLRLVVSVARTYHAHELTLLDLIQEGNLGLMRAAKKFNPDSGFKFSTYATHWIRQTIGRAISTRDRSIQVPDHIFQLERRIRKTTTQLTMTLGRAPTDAEIADDLSIPITTVQRMATFPPRRLDSLDTPAIPGRDRGDEVFTTLGDQLADTPDETMEETVERDDERNHLHELLRTHLDERELAILLLRYTQAAPKPMAYRQVAKQLGISGEMARLIEAAALTKLRKVLTLDPDGGVIPAPAKKRPQRTPTKKPPAPVTTKPDATPHRRARPLKQLTLFGDVA